MVDKILNMQNVAKKFNRLINLATSDTSVFKTMLFAKRGFENDFIQ